MNTANQPTDDLLKSIHQELTGVVRGLKAQLEKQGGDSVLLGSKSKIFKSKPLEAKTIEPRTITESMAEIRADLGDCKRCRLCDKRTNIVFGNGSEQSRLMFIGEGPGADEDLQGLPFVGRAGQLLTKMIAAIGLTREQVYIANIVKCRPPQNRNPEPDEIATCLPFLKRQISMIRPKVICALGKIATQALLGVETPISQMRGRFYPVDNIPIMATYHPAYLLRNPAAKRPVWEDLQAIKRELEK
jgi:DNA polymerase